MVFNVFNGVFAEFQHWFWCVDFWMAYGSKRNLHPKQKPEVLDTCLVFISDGLSIHAWHGGLLAVPKEVMYVFRVAATSPQLSGRVA